MHLIDGTYELFRHYHALPKMADSDGREVVVVRGVLTSMMALVQNGATHIGVATDYVIKSFRTTCCPTTKTGVALSLTCSRNFLCSRKP